VPATTEDGLWKWDGARWQSTKSFEGRRPEDLAATLSVLAEDRYAEAGVILAGYVVDWQPEVKLQQLAEQAREVGERLRRTEDALATDGQSRGGILGRRGAPFSDRRQLEEERDALRSEYRALTSRLGREAPQPSVKEADDVLGAARNLDERAALLTAGLAEVDEAERMRADAAVSAQKELATAEEVRLRSLQEARRAVEAAEAAHAWAVAEARGRLRSVLTPGSGELKAGLGLLRLHATVLETPSGRLPAAGLAAYADTAGELWRQHRNPLVDLILLETPEAESFLTALTEGGSALFLLIIGPTGAALWSCPPGQEKGARRFAAVVAEHAREAAADKQEREAKARKAENELDSVTRDRSRVEAAEAELARIEADPGLLGAIDEARQRLERARADTPELTDARSKVVELARRVIAPPEPLRVAK
jgi:DNA repair exonuclease SbcCD ATPase subunit